MGEPGTNIREVQMPLPYENASSGDKALAEIQRVLQRFGCQRFGVMTDWEKGELLVQFEWNGRRVSFPASFRGYAEAWLKENPWTSRRQSTREQWERKAFEVGSVAVYSILRDWIKAQVTAIETGLLTFESVFMPHMLGRDGKRLIEHVQETGLLALPETEQGGNRGNSP